MLPPMLESTYTYIAFLCELLRKPDDRICRSETAMIPHAASPQQISDDIIKSLIIILIEKELVMVILYDSIFAAASVFPSK